MLPKDLATGRYLVRLVLGPAEFEVPGHLQVLEDDALRVQLESIIPVTGYVSVKHDGFDFDIAGPNLARSSQDNIIQVVGEGPQAVGSEIECKNYERNSHYDKLCLSYDPGMEGKRVHVRGYHPAKYKGPVDIKVQVGNNTSNVLRTTFSGITEQGVRLTAILVFGLLLLIVVGLVWKGIGGYKIDGETYSPLSSFFLDKETNSFSLSKFQLLAWTAVAVFGYLYLFLCRMLIQWDFSFPPIPDGLPMLLGVSAGTTVAAAGITVTRGSKGAGPVQPSMADFVSSGGLVLSDRFQFFVWTLVGCLGFVGLVLKSDASTLKELPKIPDNFLYLMGISSAGYLSGKLVRKPGPVIRLLSVTAAAPSVVGTPMVPAMMTIVLKGENLSSRAGVKVDDRTLRTDQYLIKTIKPQDQAPDPLFCAEIELTLKDAELYLEGAHTLTFTNEDGQMAASGFPIDPLTVDSIPEIPHGTAAANVIVTGKNFGEHTTAQWKDATGSIAAIPEAQVRKTSDIQLSVALTPGATAGQGTLTLISQIGLRASKNVNIT
jgi:hypothetical protein